jgi:hypothetical protein
MFYRILYWLKGPRWTNKITVSFDFITQSGNEISRTDESMTLKKYYVPKNDDYYIEKWDVIRQITSDMREQLNKRSDKLLTENQKRQRVTLNQGKLDNGKYIVKCVWDIDCQMEDMPFEKWKKMVK